MSGARRPYTPTFYEVPSGTGPSQCRGESCQAVVFWIRTEKNRPMPIDCEVDGGFEPTQQDAGRGVSHFTTCPDVRQFSGKNRAANA